MKKRREFIKKSVMGTAGLAFAGLGFSSHSLNPTVTTNKHISVPTVGSLDQKNQNEKAVSEFGKIKKIDVHMHITSDADYLREVMDYFNLKMFVMCNEGLKLERLKLQVDVAIDISKRYPRYYAWQTTFGFEGLEKPAYANKVNEYLKYGFDNGALAVKVWKEIGMQLKNIKGEFVQVDDPIFDPIFNYIAKEGKTLFTHIGDPVSNWLSVGPDGTQNRWYKESSGISSNRIGEFRGEVPHDKLILAHDRMLSKHPDLKVVGCHMGSTEFDVDVAARRLDKYPNLALETSAVISYLMGQAREKVRAFFIKYQDRILYALDKSGGLVATDFFVDMSKVNMRWTQEEVVEEKKKLMQNYNNDFEYYITDNEINRGSYSIRGLALPEEVLHKFFYANAVKWVPGINEAF